MENLIKEDNTLFPGYIATTFTKPVTLSATVVVSNMYVAGMISAEATLAANVGVDFAAAVNGQDFFKLKLLISGRFKIMGMNLVEGAMLIDLDNPFAPRIDFALALGGPASPLGLLLPVAGMAKGTFNMEFLSPELLQDVSDIVFSKGVGNFSFDGLLDEITGKLGDVLLTAWEHFNPTFKFDITAQVQVFGIPLDEVSIALEISKDRIGAGFSVDFEKLFLAAMGASLAAGFQSLCAICYDFWKGCYAKGLF